MNPQDNMNNQTPQNNDPNMTQSQPAMPTDPMSNPAPMPTQSQPAMPTDPMSNPAPMENPVPQAPAQPEKKKGFFSKLNPFK